MVSNRRLVEKTGPDFYPTPEWGTLALLKYVSFDGEILEPCCGDGAMSEVLSAAGYAVDSSDLYDRGYGSQRDFFDIQKPCKNIVTNPPFNIAAEMIDHALNVATGKVCFLLRTAFLESASRYEMFYRRRAPKTILVFSQRLSMYPKGSSVKGGGTTSYSWFIWDKRTPYGNTEVIWIEPGLKPGSRKA